MVYNVTSHIPESCSELGKQRANLLDLLCAMLEFSKLPRLGIPIKLSKFLKFLQKPVLNL